MAKIALNFVARANTAPLVTSLHQVRTASNQAMGGMQTNAIRVQGPLVRLNKQIQTGRLSWRDLNRTMRNSSRIIAENNALTRAQARSFVDAAGNATVYLNVIRGTAATQATLNQRLRLGVTALKAFGSQTIATGKQVQWAGRQVMIGLSLPLVALAAAATRGAEEYDKQMTRIVKVTNLSAVGMKNSMGEFVETFQIGTDQMQLAIESIERQADRLAGVGASMGFMAGETSKLAAEFSQMGFAGVALDGLSEAALRLSRVSGADLKDSMNLTRLAAMAFGKELGSEDNPNSLIQTFARLNMIENRTSLSLAEMAGAIPIVAGVAKNLSIEIETLGGMLALMKDKGIAAREGATSLRTGLIRLVQDATDPAIKAFEKLNINITELQEMNRGNVFGLITDLSHLLYDVQNSGDQAAEKTELFIAAIGKMVGTRAAARFTSMLEGIGRDIEQYTEIVDGFEVQQFRFIEGVDKAGDAFRAMSPALMDANVAMRQFLFEEERVNQSLAGTAEILRAELNLELRRLGRQILPVKNALMAFARDLVRGFNSLNDRTRTTIMVFAGLVAILGPATMIFGVMLNAFGQLITLFSRMLPGIKLTTAAIEAEKKAFDRNNASIVANTSSKQAMIQTNGALATSTNAVTAAVSAQAGAYAALSAGMAGAAGRAGAGGAVALRRAGAATRRRATSIDPTTGATVPRRGMSLDPTTGRYRDSGSFATAPTRTSAQGNRPGGEKIMTAAETLMIAAVAGPMALAAIPARQRFNPTLGMASGHENLIRQMLNPNFLMSQMPDANVAQLTARSPGGMSPIQAVHQKAFREAVSRYEIAAAQAIQSKQRVPSVQEFMRSTDQQALVRSAVLRAGTEGIVDPKGVARFAPQPQGLREMAGLGGRMDSRDVLQLTREQRANFRRQFGVDVGRRAQIGQIEAAVRTRGGSTAAFNARNMLEDMVDRGEARTTRRTMTRQDLVAQDRAFVRREVESAVAQRRIADTPEARRQLAREITPARALPGEEGRRAMTRDRALGARETMLGKRAPQTAFEKGMSAGRNAALMALMLPFKMLIAGFKKLTTSLFGIIPVFRIVSALIMATTAPALAFFGNALMAAAAGLTALLAASFNLTKGFLVNRAATIANKLSSMRHSGTSIISTAASRQAIGAPLGVGGRLRRSRDNILGRKTAGRAATARMQNLQTALGGPLGGPAPRATTPMVAGSLARGSGTFASRSLVAASTAARGVGMGAMGALSMIPGLGILGRIGKTAMKQPAIPATGVAPGLVKPPRPGVLSRTRAALAGAAAQDPIVRGYRGARDARLGVQSMGGAAGPVLPSQIAKQRAAATKAQRGRAALSGVRGAMMAKGGLAGFAAGGAMGAALTIAAPIVLTLFGAAIANPDQFKKGFMDIFGPTLETVKRIWDGLTSSVRRLMDTLRGGGDDADGFGSKLAKWAGIISGVIGGTLGSALSIALGLAQGLVNVLNGIFQWLQGNGDQAAQSFGMAWRSVWGAILESVANFFDMFRDLPVIGGMFGRVADAARGFADQTNSTLEAMQLIPNAVSDVERGVRQLKSAMEENTKEIEDIDGIIEDLARFEIVDQDEIQRLVDMVTVTADMTEEQLRAREDNVDAVYDELVAMEHLTDEQITQLGQYIMRKRKQSELEALLAKHQELQNLLLEASNDTNESIESSQIAQLRLAQLRARAEAELAKDVEDRNQGYIDALVSEAAAIRDSNNQRVSTAGLHEMIAQLAEEIADTEKEILDIGNEVNRQVANRKQAIDMARQATAEEANEMERLGDEAERAKREIQAIQSAMGEVMGDITSVVSDIVRNQRDFISNYFSDLSDASKQYFDNFKEMFQEQTDIMLDEIEERSNLELDLIDEVAEATIAAIEEEIEAENKLERKREEFFRRERARIDFLASRRAGEIKIQEEILRGNLAEAAILQVQQRSMSQEFYSNIVQEREQELKEMRNEARQQRIQDINFERETLRQEVEIETQAMRDKILRAREFANEEVSISNNTSDQLIANARRAADEAREVEEQRIQNYLREWQRVTPATEEEFKTHTQNLQNFMTESGLRLQEETNLIFANLRNSLAEIDADFTESVNNQSRDLGTMLSNSRFTLEGIYESVRITSENSLMAMLGMVDGFTEGLAGGFTSGLQMTEVFSKKFERELAAGMAEARRIALLVISQEDKWREAGERAAAAYLEGLNAIQAGIDASTRPGQPRPAPGAPAPGSALPAGVAEDEWDHLSIRNAIRANAGRTSFDDLVDQAGAGTTAADWQGIPLVDHGLGPSNLSPAQQARRAGTIDYTRFAGETPEMMADRLSRINQARLGSVPDRGFMTREERDRIAGQPVIVHPDVLDRAKRQFPGLNIEAAPRGVQAEIREFTLQPMFDAFRRGVDMMGQAEANRSQQMFGPTGTIFRHSGGFVGKLGSDEVPAVLQAGEYVIQKSAVASMGTNLLDSINNSSAMFSTPALGRLSIAASPQQGSSSETVYNLNFNIDGGNIDESKLAQKVVFEIKKMERSSGGGRRVSV